MFIIPTVESVYTNVCTVGFKIRIKDPCRSIFKFHRILFLHSLNWCQKHMWYRTRIMHDSITSLFTELFQVKALLLSNSTWWCSLQLCVPKQTCLYTFYLHNSKYLTLRTYVTNRKTVVCQEHAFSISIQIIPKQCINCVALNRGKSSHAVCR